MTELKLDPRNARRHSDRNKRQIKQSLETVGAGRSILADADGIVRAGNGVFAEWGDKPVKIVPTDGTELVVVQRTDLRGQDAIRAAALDNLVADSSAFDYDAAILAEIARDDDVIRAIANEDAKLRELLRKENGTTEKVDAGELIDKAAQLQEKWCVKRGEVWQVGKHRLMCGDSTSKEDVERLMDGKRAQVGISDPPYGINIDTSWLTALHIQRGKPANLSDDKLQGDDGSFDSSICFALDKWLVWGFPYVGDCRATGWLVWDKWPGVDGGGLGNPIEMASTNLWEGFRLVRLMWGGYYKARGEKREPHPTQKPVGVVTPFIDQCTKRDELIMDVTLGSGTTLVACEQTGRIGYGMEIEPKYCSVALERLANLGLQPQRLESQITGI